MSITFLLWHNRKVTGVISTFTFQTLNWQKLKGLKIWSISQTRMICVIIVCSKISRALSLIIKLQSQHCIQYMPLIVRCYMIQISLLQCNVLRNLFVIDYFKDELLHKIITMYPIVAKISLSFWDICLGCATLYTKKRQKHYLP